MTILFKSSRTKKVLSNERLIKKYHGAYAKSLMNRLVELKAVSNLSLISHEPPPRKHRLKGEFDGCWAVDVSRNHRLIFKPCVEQEGYKEGAINCIVILKIEDYH